MIRRGGALTIVLLLAAAAPAGAATITVNTTADQFGTGGACSLREAVQAANVNTYFGGCARRGDSQSDLILLRPGKTYTRSIAGADDSNATGDLDVTRSVEIRPSGRRGRATIDAASLSRVLEILAPARVTISRLNLRGGLPADPGETREGGGVRVASGARLRISDSSIAENRVGGPSAEGGGIANRGTLSASRVRIAKNRVISMGAANGAGILNADSGSATLDRVTVTGNEASNVGAGISNYSGRLTITRSTIAGNTAGYGGGGIYAGGAVTPGAVVVRETTVSGNTALANSTNAGGGGISVGDFGGGTTRLFNTTVSGNSTRGVGGGISVYAGQTTAHGSTIVFNTADSDADGTGGGGGISGFVAFANSIVAANKDLNPGVKSPDCSGASSAGHSLVGDTNGCGTGPSDVTGKAPLLGPLAANGGPTKTHLPKAASPAVNRGSPLKPGKDVLGTGACTARDQRGIRRPQGSRCDIGAVERRASGRP
ncbi:MAG: CSLREA domain-containing protein [Solirubrobacterales bacterium]